MTLKLPEIPELVELTCNVDFALIDIFVDEVEDRREVKNHRQVANILKAAKLASRLHSLATRQQRAIEFIMRTLDELCDDIDTSFHKELIRISKIKAQKIINGDEK